MNPFWTAVVNAITSFFAALPFSGATWFVLATLAFFVWLFVRADRTPGSPVQWEHLIIDSNNDRTSPYKVGYLVGLIVGTWIILRLTDDGKLDFDMFGVYLTYLLGGAGVNSFVKRGDRSRYDTQYGNEYDEVEEPPKPRKYGGQKRKTTDKAPTGGAPDYGPSLRDVDTE